VRGRSNGSVLDGEVDASLACGLQHGCDNSRIDATQPADRLLMTRVLLGAPPIRTLTRCMMRCRIRSSPCSICPLPSGHDDQRVDRLR
jgi:hypothetical protein